jgi:hypothetical protein
MSLKPTKLTFTALLAVILVSLFSGAGFGASVLLGDGEPAYNDEQSMSRVIEDGTKVECLGVMKYNGNSILTVVSAFLGVVYRVTTPKDMIMTIGDDLDLFDSDGEQFHCYKVTIGKGGVDDSASKKRELIEGVPTQVIVWYSTENKKYQLTSKYPRASFVINGEKLTFRNVSLYQ